MINEQEKQTAAYVINGLYKKTLLDKAIVQIRNSNPSTDEFVLLKLEADYLEVGYLTFYTEEGVCNDWSEKMGLTENDIGEPCEYWTMALTIEPNGEVVEAFTCNDVVWKHPNWPEIIKKRSIADTW